MEFTAFTASTNTETCYQIAAGPEFIGVGEIFTDLEEAREEAARMHGNGDEIAILAIPPDEARALLEWEWELNRQGPNIHAAEILRLIDSAPRTSRAAPPSLPGLIEEAIQDGLIPPSSHPPSSHYA